MDLWVELEEEDKWKYERKEDWELIGDVYWFLDEEIIVVDLGNFRGKIFGDWRKNLGYLIVEEDYYWEEKDDYMDRYLQPIWIM